MIDDEEKQLRRELLDLDLKLRRKQEFWETPRNLAILVGLTALIAAAIGYWLGRGSASLPLLLRPITNRGLDPMRPDQLVDAVQTAGILVIAAMLVYVVLRLDRTLTAATGELKKALTVQQALWRRLDQIEQQSDRGALGDAARAWERISRIEARLEALEKGEPPPEGARPTDPPFGSNPQ